jgi:hypothetical protein
MADVKLIAVLSSGRTFALRLEEGMTPEQALADLTGTGGGLHVGSMRPEWFDTEERFRIRRDAIIALVVGHKQGEWAVADS